MIRIQDELEKRKLKSKMTLQVHDELNFSVPQVELDEVRELVVREMEQAIALKVPLIAECGVGANWLEAH
ncbi:MAG: polymerase [Bacteroidetes bacterium]|nr:polymerase [Bacteroidota bacterium]